MPNLLPSHFPLMKRIAILASCIVPTISAFAGSPSVGQVIPAAGQRGTEAEITFSGANLGDARTLLFDQPGIECVSVSEATAGKFKAKLKIAADARLGEYAFRAITNSGVGDVRLFYVTPYPVVKEADEEAKDPYKVQPAKIGTTYYGSAPGEDQEHFEVELKKGQRLSAEVVGVRISTQSFFDGHLKVTDAAGKELAEVDDGAFTRQDPALSIIAPGDGKYRVILRDSTNNGTGACNYLLHLGSHPRPTVVFPLGGMAGETVKFTMLGDAGGAFEQTVKLPDQPQEKFEIIAQKDGLSAPQPNTVRVSLFPDVMEVEPNNTIETATPVKTALPVALNGIISEKGDVDYFRITAQKGTVYEVNVRARMMRSPLDSVLEICNEKGARLASNDDAGGPDSYLRWTAPNDGDFFIKVHDQLMRGGPLFAYRVEITKVEPALITYLPEIVINSSQQRRAVPVPKGNRYATLVRVKRSDVGGDVVLDPQGLPPGVTVVSNTMDKGVDAVPMIFNATTDAAPVQKTFQLLPKLTDAAANATVAARVEHRVEIVENGNQRPFYGVDENTLALAVTEEVPVMIELAQPKVPVLQDGQMNLKITATRKAGAEGKPVFNGPMPVQVLYAPTAIGTPGVVNLAEGAAEGTVTISANATAPAGKWKTCVVASLDLPGGAVWVSTGLVEIEIAPAFLAAAIKRTFVDQGTEGSISVALDQKVPFEGKAKLRLDGLPQGVTAEEKEITKDDKEVKFAIKAAPDAQPGQHKTVIATFTLLRDGEPMVNTVARGGILRVDKATAAPKVAGAK